jgi:hypothetical protein
LFTQIFFIKNFFLSFSTIYKHIALFLLFSGLAAVYFSCQKDAKNAPIITTTTENAEATERTSCNYPTYCDASAVYSGTCTKSRKGSSPNVPGMAFDLIMTQGFKTCSPPANAASSFTECIQFLPQLNGIIWFSDFGELRQVLGVTDPLYNAHHIIPRKHCDSKITSNSMHPVVKKATLDGFHPCDGYNGVSILATLNSPGGHTNYNDYVKFQMDEFNKPANKQNATFKEANTWIQCKLIPHLRIKINAAVTSNPAQSLQTYFGTTFPAPWTYIGS